MALRKGLRNFHLVLTVILTWSPVVGEAHANDICMSWKEDRTLVIYIRTWHDYKYQKDDGHCNPLSTCPMEIVDPNGVNKTYIPYSMEGEAVPNTYYGVHCRGCCEVCGENDEQSWYAFEDSGRRRILSLSFVPPPPPPHLLLPTSPQSSSPTS
ncbi:hypothetical protein CYMTET_30169 [Cymbomonas tetramitiformis]|uniref:Uncharacterized protein n=1 Tax=Cymbomonas tetramitiformis TaxID=36881 RepID=A0AAE0KU67_9CHLO|nr:hypothetical protein CYMTET_30169 [Cymbomonas tetramitiformis]